MRLRSASAGAIRWWAMNRAAAPKAIRVMETKGSVSSAARRAMSCHAIKARTTAAMTGQTSRVFSRNRPTPASRTTGR